MKPTIPRDAGRNGRSVQVRVRADVVPSLKAQARHRGVTLTEVVSEAVVEWLERYDPTWEDSIVLMRLRARLVTVHHDERRARLDIDDLDPESVIASDYDGHYSTEDAQRRLQEDHGEAIRRHKALAASEKKLVDAVSALSGESKEHVIESLEHE